MNELEAPGRSLTLYQIILDSREVCRCVRSLCIHCSSYHGLRTQYVRQLSGWCENRSNFSVLRFDELSASSGRRELLSTGK